MPIPKRNQGEPEQEFISSCIKKLLDEYDVSQATAICYQQLDIHLSTDSEWRKWFMNTKNTSTWIKK
jgi:predicted nuclease of restriction endonuclease-like RecB superfamily